MFKRVEKRRQKKRDEEELGLDEDMKDVLGLQDTDSDESDSESDSDGSSNDRKDSDGDDSVRETSGRKRKRGAGGEGGEHEEADEEADDGLEDSTSDGDLSQPTLSVHEALKDPLYIISLQPDVKGCIVCPGKQLKNLQMCNVHNASKAHMRRFKLFAQVAAKARPDENAWDVLQCDVSFETAKASPKPAEKLSKRAEKRNAKIAAVMTKREKQKAMKAKAIAKQAAKAVSPVVDSMTLSPSITAKPAKKKRKMDTTTDDVFQMKAEKPQSAVTSVKKTPKKVERNIAREIAGDKAKSAARPLKRKRVIAQALDDMQSPRAAEKSFKRKGKSKPHRTKEKVQGLVVDHYFHSR